MAQVKILSYNTSYVNDAHHSILHNFLSESASIMQKAIRVYMTNEEIQGIITNRDSDTNWAANLYKALSAKDNANGSSDPDYNLENIRLKMADAATNHIAEKMNLESPDFCALIEQTIHVPDDNPASYPEFGDKHGMKKYNLGDETNNNYGILRRIKQLGDRVNDLNTSTNTTTTGAKYNIVYDNVINTGASGVAEGIAICMDAVKYPTTNLYKWNRTELPIVSQLATQYKVVTNTLKPNDVYFYSDDLGKVVTDATFNRDNTIYCVRKSDAIADMGRPIMLSICQKENDIHIFVAVHSVNLFQLKAIKKEDVDYFNKYRETYNVIKSWIAELQEKQNNEDVSGIIKYLKSTEIYKKCTEIAATKMIKDMISGVQTLVNEICKTICNSIGAFITQSFLNAQTPQNNNASPQNVHVYLAGDFNDPQGHILKILNSDGITFKISENEYCVKFPIENTEPNVKILDHSPCCANADSCKNPTNTHPLGPIGASTIERIYGATQNDEKKYPVYNDNNRQFIDSENFNYKGDYALYGKAVQEKEQCVVRTTITGFTTNDVLLTLDAQVSEHNNTIMASDHQSVFATYTSASLPQGGGNRHKNKQYHNSRKKRRSINRHSSNEKNLRRTPRSRSVVPK